MRKKDLLNFNVKVYALINPYNKKVFYVGCTKLSLEQRLRHHLCAKIGIPIKRYQLIQTIKTDGLKLAIKLLREVHFNDASSTELYYYNLFESKGNELIQSKSAFHYSKSNAEKIISGWQIDQRIKREKLKFKWLQRS